MLSNPGRSPPETIINDGPHHGQMDRTAGMIAFNSLFLGEAAKQVFTPFQVHLFLVISKVVILTVFRFNGDPTQYH